MYKRTCLICNEEFETENSRSNMCDKVHLKECVICGTKFEITISNRNKKKTCSQSCNAKLGFQNRAQKVNCLFCGEEFIKRTNTHRYCKPKHLAHCPMCNKEKQYPNSNIEKQDNKLIANVTCSKRCRSNKKRETSLEKYGVESPTQSKEVQDKMKATNLERYGSENVFASDYGKEKIRETNLERYGAENPMQNEEVKEKVKQTNLEKYGGVAPAQNKEVQEKMKRTTFERYGVENAYTSPEIQEKIKQTNLEKYGTEYASQSEEVKKKIAQTNLEKYGTENVYASEYGKAKIKETMLERHGVEHALQSEEIMKKLKQTSFERYGTGSPNQKHMLNINDWNNLEEYLKSLKERPDCLQLVNYFGVTLSSVRRHISRLGLQDYIDGFYKFSTPELTFKSLLEAEIPEVKYIPHDRQQIKPLEIDFYFPDHNLGVEISPMYTHCYKYSEGINYGIADKQYHYDKFKACEEAGIELITVFDWHDLEKVIELIKNKVSPAKQVLYARKCSIRYSDSITKEHREFLNKYHVLGQINNKSNKYGKSFVLELTYNDEVVGLAVYYPYSEDTVELKRLAFKDGITIVGGASKLLKHVFDYVDVKQVLTFSDNNLGTGNVYKTIGFDLVEDVKGTLQFYNYEYSWLVRDTSLWMVGADRLLLNFPGYTPVGIGPDKPGNREIVMSYGFEPMFDCGYRKWLYKR